MTTPWKWRYRQLVSSLLCGVAFAGCSTNGPPTTPSTQGAAMLSKVNPPSFGYRVLHDFARKSDGYFPTGSLTDVSGTLYGTTRYGGYGNNGTVFSLSPSGREKVVYSFRKASEDGAKPVAALIDVGGVLY